MLRSKAELTELPREACIDADTDGPNRAHGVLEPVLVSSLDLGVSRDRGPRIRRGELASTVGATVSIRGLGVNFSTLLGDDC